MGKKTKIKTVGVEIEGICPMLFNRFTEEAQEGLEKGSQGKKRTKSERLEEAFTKVYRKNGEGDIGVPAINIKKSILVGCQMAGIKIGRRSAEPYMRASMFLDTDFVSLNRKEPDNIHECTGRIPPGKGGKMAIIRRPYVDAGWKLKFGLILSDERVAPSMVQVALAEAGLIVGLCDHRPEFGRFKINKFK